MTSAQCEGILQNNHENHSVEQKHSKREHHQWRIQDFPQGGAPTPKIAIIFQIFAENCMKMKEFETQGGARPWRPPLDPPMITFYFELK